MVFFEALVENNGGRKGNGLTTFKQKQVKKTATEVFGKEGDGRRYGKSCIPKWERRRVRGTFINCGIVV